MLLLLLACSAPNPTSALRATAALLVDTGTQSATSPIDTGPTTTIGEAALCAPCLPVTQCCVGDACAFTIDGGAVVECDGADDCAAALLEVHCASCGGGPLCP